MQDIIGAFLCSRCFHSFMFNCFVKVQRGTFKFLMTLLFVLLLLWWVFSWRCGRLFCENLKHCSCRILKRHYLLPWIGNGNNLFLFSCFDRATQPVTAFPAGLIMITPAFELSQDPDFLTIIIRVPYARASEFDVYFEGQDFKFYAKPYFLRQVVERLKKNWIS